MQATRVAIVGAGLAGLYAAYLLEPLSRLFGPMAETSKAEFIKDWARDPYTATESDQEPGAHLEGAPAHTANTGPWRNRLIGIASEWSPEFPGYLAGAIDAAARGVAALR